MTGKPFDSSRAPRNLPSTHPDFRITSIPSHSFTFRTTPDQRIASCLETYAQGLDGFSHHFVKIRRRRAKGKSFALG
jgi:hypothetical protein